MSWISEPSTVSFSFHKWLLKVTGWIDIGCLYRGCISFFFLMGDFFLPSTVLPKSPFLWPDLLTFCSSGFSLVEVDQIADGNCSISDDKTMNLCCFTTVDGSEIKLTS